MEAGHGSQAAERFQTFLRSHMQLCKSVTATVQTRKRGSTFEKREKNSYRTQSAVVLTCRQKRLLSFWAICHILRCEQSLFCRPSS